MSRPLKIAPSILSADYARPADQIALVAPEGDRVHVLRVTPGGGGKPFKREVLPKIAEIRRAVDQGGLDLDVQIDGGIKLETAPRAVEAGANVLVVGSAIFETPDPLEAARQIRAAASASA